MTSLLMCTSQAESILEDSTNGNGNDDGDYRDGGGDDDDYGDSNDDDDDEGGDAIDNDGGGNDVDEYS